MSVELARPIRDLFDVVDRATSEATADLAAIGRGLSLLATDRKSVV